MLYLCHHLCDLLKFQKVTDDSDVDCSRFGKCFTVFSKVFTLSSIIFVAILCDVQYVSEPKCHCDL